MNNKLQNESINVQGDSERGPVLGKCAIECVYMPSFRNWLQHSGLNASLRGRPGYHNAKGNTGESGQNRRVCNSIIHHRQTVFVNHYFTLNVNHMQLKINIFIHDNSEFSALCIMLLR